MTSELKFPLDLLSIPAFRRLRSLLEVRSAECGVRNQGHAAEGTHQALYVWFVLYRELAYKAQEGGAVGRIPAKDMAAVVAEMGLATEEQSGLAEQLVNPVGLLQRDGEDYVCPRFIVEHSGVAAHRTNAQRGGDMKAYGDGTRRAAAEATQLALQISGDKYKDELGEQLDMETIKRVNQLIRCCDKALFKSTRPAHGFTEGLIAEAVKVLKKHHDEEIDVILKFIVSKRGHPFLSNLTTEKCLPMLGEMMPRLAGGVME